MSGNDFSYGKIDLSSFSIRYTLLWCYYNKYNKSNERKTRYGSFQMIDILYSGYSYTHKNGIRFDTSTVHAGFDWWLLVFARSPVYFPSDEGMVLCPADTIILFPQNTHKFYYSPEGEPYTNDWIHFRTDESMISDFPLKGVPFKPSDPDYIHNLMKLISWEAQVNNNPSNPVIRDLFHALVSKLSRDVASRHESTYLPQLQNLRKAITLHPENPWTVAMMSDSLSISPAHLQLLYRNTFGISCMNDVIRCRIKLAQDKLLYSADTISSVGEQCGYRNTEHFCRQFRKFTGLSPRQYRIKAMQNTNREKDSNEETGI